MYYTEYKIIGMQVLRALHLKLNYTFRTALCLIEASILKLSPCSRHLDLQKPHVAGKKVNGLGCRSKPLRRHYIL